VTLVLLTTEGCHLCEQALGIIQRAAPGVKVSLLDIATDDALIDAYGERIPVLRHGDTEIDWPFGLLDVRALISGDRSAGD